MMGSKHIVQIVILAFLVVSCEKDDGIIPQCIDCSIDSLKIDTSVAQVFILSEGNYGWNNASVSLYTPDDKVNQNNVFQAANGVVLGDIVQSMEIINNQGYIVVDNSNKIEVVNLSTLKIEKTISNLNSPRYIKQVSAGKAYITSLYGNLVYVLDLESNTIESQISVNGWTEKLVIASDNAYVISPDSNKVFVVNIIQDKVMLEIPTTTSPNSIVVDRNNKIWVLCSGGFEKELAELFRLDPQTNEVEFSALFNDVSLSPEDLSIDVYGERLFYNNQSIYTMNISETTLPDVALILNESRNIYGFDVAPNSDLYLSDALNYTQEGFVYRYTSLGNMIDSFKVGIIPGGFCFN